MIWDPPSSESGLGKSVTVRSTVLSANSIAEGGLGKHCAPPVHSIAAGGLGKSATVADGVGSARVVGRGEESGGGCIELGGMLLKLSSSKRV